MDGAWTIHQSLVFPGYGNRDCRWRAAEYLWRFFYDQTKRWHRCRAHFLPSGDGSFRRSYTMRFRCWPIYDIYPRISDGGKRSGWDDFSNYFNTAATNGGKHCVLSSACSLVQIKHFPNQMLPLSFAPFIELHIPGFFQECDQASAWFSFPCWRKLFADGPSQPACHLQEIGTTTKTNIAW